MPPSTDYFAALPATDLMRVVVALATEVYALTDRMRALEAVLARSGVDLRALDAPTQPAAFDLARRSERDAFVQRVFAALEQPGEHPPAAPSRRAAGSKRAAASAPTSRQPARRQSKRRSRAL